MGTITRANVLSITIVHAFYDELAPYYHFLYPDWDASIERQARGLAAVFADLGIAPQATVLDAACGIGTQALGLAALGFHVTASDIAESAVARARHEARSRNLEISFAVADLRTLSAVHQVPFAAVVACDNAIPHLLTDAEIEQALIECHRCLRPGGSLVISVRDYDRIERKTPDIRPYGSRVEGGVEYTATQVWEWDGDQYDLRFELSELHPDGERRTHEFRSRYYAIGIARLQGLMTKAGFTAVHRRDDGFFQPLLVGTRAAAP